LRKSLVIWHNRSRHPREKGSKPIRRDVAATAIAAAIAWTLLAFGGRETWTLVPLFAALLFALAIARPSLAHPPLMILDVALALALLGGAAQLMPLPAGWRDVLSPHTAIVERALRVGAAWSPLDPVTGPLSINPTQTAIGLLTAVAAVLLFWIARAPMESGELRGTAARVAWIGFAVSLAAILQRATSPKLMYWIWSVPGDKPFGPFINRNHMATWLIMAIPLAVGCLMMRVRSRVGEHGGRVAFVRVVGDSTVLWLSGAAGLMLAALLVSLSRSGVMGLAAGAVVGGAIGLPRLRAAERHWLWLLPVGAVVVATFYASPGALLDRFARSRTLGAGGRVEIWRQTLPIIRDFPATGAGIGTYEQAMLVYQEGNRQFFFNQAHNQYLQLAAEGGLLVCVPAFVATLVFVALVLSRIRRDRSEAFWTQSIWETGLRMPANAVLFGLMAAISVSEPRGGSKRDAR
jgi:O-antigen ligase